MASAPRQLRGLSEEAMIGPLRPRALQPGDTVAVAALSGPLVEGERALLEAGISVLESLGFAPVLSPLVDVRQSWWWSAARPETTAAELNRLLRDPQVRAVFALTGGRSALGYLDLVDYDAIRRDPKLIVGFSDISTLLLALHQRTGLAGLHAELVTHGFGEWAGYDAVVREELLSLYARVLTKLEVPGELPRFSQWECWRGGSARGPLLGGMLNRIVRLQAGPYALSPERWDKAILFWEETAVNVSSIWNDLHALGGVLDRIGGMVVGRSLYVQGVKGADIGVRDVVLDVLGSRDVPVLGNVDVGHELPNLPLPLGVIAELEPDRLRLALAEPVVA